MTKLLWLLLFIPTVCLAQKSTVFDAGVNVRLLKDNLVFKNRVTKIMSSDADSPNSVAKSAGIGSLYMELDTGHWWWKSDSGSSTNWTRLPYGDTGGNLFLAPAGATELIFDLQGGQQYAMGADGSNALYIQSQTAATPSSLFLFSEDGDASDFVNFAIYGSGSPDGANEHFSVLQWDATNIQYELQTGAGGTGAEQDLSIFAGAGNLNQLFLDQSSGNVSIKGSGPSSSLDVNGAIEQSGNELLGKSLLVGGSFEDGSPGPFTDPPTAGTLSPETTNVLFGSQALDVTSATTIDTEACVTNAQWEGRQVEVGCYVKSTLNDISLCFNDGTVDDTCNSSYDGSDKWKYVFQRGTPASGESMCLHITSPSAGTIELDNCEIKEPEFSTAELSEITPWTPFAATGSWTGAVAYAGKWRRIGDTMEVITEVSLTGALTSGGINLSLDLPSGYTIDTAKLFANVNEEGIGISTWRRITGGPIQYDGQVIYESTTSVRPKIDYPNPSVGTDLRVMNATDLWTKGAGDYVYVQYKVPIEGWSAKRKSILADVDSEPLERFSQSTPVTLTTGVATKITLNTVDYGVAANFNAGTNEYTIPSSGKWRLKGFVEYVSNATGARLAQIRVGGVTLSPDYGESTSAVNGIETRVSVTVEDEFQKGDVITLYGYQTSGGNLDARNSVLTLERMDVEALLAGLEDTAKGFRAGISTTINYTLGSATEQDVIFDEDSGTGTAGTLLYDTEGAFNTSTGIYTVPESGDYVMGFALRLGNAINERWSGRIRRVSDNQEITVGDGVFTSGHLVHNTAVVRLVKGEQFKVTIDSSTDLSYSIQVGGTYFFASRVQNLSTGADFVEKFQTKTLSADITTNTADVTDLKFQNMDIGSCYELCGKLKASMTNLSSIVRLDVDHNGSDIFIINNPQDTAITQTHHSGECVQFIATDTDLVSSITVAGGSSAAQGDGTTTETYLQLKEKECIETSQW